MTVPEDCIFCARHAMAIVAENDRAFAVRDRNPVKPLHTLLIPKRHSRDIFETTEEEREALHDLARRCLADIRSDDPSVEGLNFGSNIGSVAGQKVFHTHIHLIPRRSGDLPPPPARER
jgi:diadenosine tetraphosphate (Ap4A) HIT family hydrolase